MQTAVTRLDDTITTILHASLIHAAADEQTLTATDLASLITYLHRLPITDTHLPAWDPIPDLRHRIADTEHTDPDDLPFLLECCDGIQAQLPVLDYALPTGVEHSDAHLGNLIPTSRGTLWCDLTTDCIRSAPVTPPPGPATPDLPARPAEGCRSVELVVSAV